MMRIPIAETNGCESPGQQAAGLSKATTAVLFIWFTIISFVITGYRHIYGGNHPFQLVLVQKLNDPTLYSNDPFADTIYSYASTFWYLVAWLSRVVDLSLVLFAFFLVAKFMFLLAGFRLGRTFFPDVRYAPVVGLIVMATFPQLLFAGGYPSRDTNQTVLCLGALFLAFDAFLNRNWKGTALWFGLATNLNLMFSIYGLTYLAASWLLYLRTARSIEFFGKPVVALVVGVLIGAPSIYLVFKAATYKEYNPIHVWQACELTNSIHFYPQVWSLSDQLLTLLLAIASVFVVYRFRDASPFGGHIAVWTLVAIGWYLLAYANVLLIHSLPLLSLHPARALVLWKLTAMIFLASFVVYLVRYNDFKLTNKISLILHSMMLIFIIFIDKASAHMLSIVPLVLSGVLCEIGRRVFLRLAISSTELLLALVAAITVSITAPGILLGATLAGKHSVFDFFQSPAIQIAEWARNNTPRESVFLIPISDETGWTNFRHISQRNVLTYHKDGSAWTYAPWFAEEWLSRLKALGYYEFAGLNEKSYTIGSWLYKKDFERFYDTIDDKKVEQLRKQYRIDYWITRASVKSRFPRVYEHEGWQVLKVSD